MDLRVKGLALGSVLGFKCMPIAGLHCNMLYYHALLGSENWQRQELLSPKEESVNSGPVDGPRRHAGSVALHHLPQFQPAIFPPKTTKTTQDVDAQNISSRHKISQIRTHHRLYIFNFFSIKILNFYFVFYWIFILQNSSFKCHNSGV